VPAAASLFKIWLDKSCAAYRDYTTWKIYRSRAWIGAISVSVAVIIAEAGAGARAGARAYGILIYLEARRNASIGVLGRILLLPVLRLGGRLVFRRSGGKRLSGQLSLVMSPL